MIEIIRLSREIEGRRILNDITLNIEKGKILAVIGPSGSGKTSLLRIIAGLDMPSHGEITIDGQMVSSPVKLFSPTLRNISMIFQDLALWPHMTVQKSIKFVIKEGLFRHKREVRKRIQQILSMMYLTEYKNRYPDELSGGEKQRLAIARALASEPEYLLMDEPFTNLDDLLKRELLEITLSLKNKNRMTIIYVTHNIEEAFFLADRIAAINKGRIVKTWCKEEIKDLSKEEVIQSCFI